MQITLTKNDPRLGILTWEGRYMWPPENIIHAGYQIPNVEPHYLKELPDDRGSRWFVILCLGYFDAEVHVGDVVNEPTSPLLETENAQPIDNDTNVINEPPKPRGKGKRGK